MAVVPEPGPSVPPSGDLTSGRPVLIAELSDQLGSSREATWIVEHAEAVSAGDPAAVRPLAILLADRRASGEPLQYVLGRWQFRTLELDVDQRVLIPRPETEQVVEVALGELARIAAGRATDGASVVCVDLGTGSGAIALSLAVEAKADVAIEVWATDASADALAVAGANLANLAARDPEASARVTMVEGSWFDALPSRLERRVDLIVSNPPYVSQEEYVDLEPVVREWEPLQALVAPRGRSGVAGMADIEDVIAGAVRWLRPGGALVVELAPSQAYAAIDAARRAGFTRVGTALDLAGRMRMLVAAAESRR